MWDNNAPRVGAWPYLTGCVIYLVMSLVCFTGYCLPRSNVSYHAMMVLINLLSVVPLYGRALVVAAFGHRAPALSRMIMVHLSHPVGYMVTSLWATIITIPVWGMMPLRRSYTFWPCSRVCTLPPAGAALPGRCGCGGAGRATWTPGMLLEVPR